MSSSEKIANSKRQRHSGEVSTTGRIGRFALEVIGSLAMLVVLNFFALWYLGNFTTSYGYWTLHQKWEILGKLDAPVDWVVLGDSSCNQGVTPTIIEEQLGETAVNLCAIGNVTALNDIWMLEEYIQRFGPPKGVVIGHVYDIWPRDLDPVILGQIPRPWGFWREHTLGSEVMDDPAIRSELFQERFVPLLSQRLTLTKILRSITFEQLLPFKPKWQLDEVGFLNGEQAHPETVIQDGKDHMQFVRENDPFISSINHQALERLVEIADTYQLPIYLVNSPLYEGLAADEDFQAHLAELHGQIVSVVGESQFIHPVSEVKTFPADLLQTADHLILSGAQVYTEWLIERVIKADE